MNSPLQSRKNAIIICCCFLITLFFAYTVYLRKPWFNRPLAARDHEKSFMHSVWVTNNWLKEGAFKLRFMHVLLPPSIEFNSLESRRPYVSYPPGAFIPVFLLAKAFNIKDLVSLYRGYNLFNQWIISLIFFLIMFQMIYYFRNINICTVFFSLAPAIVYLYTAPTLYWHQNIFFADQAVMMLFAVFIYLEMKSFLYGRLNKWNRIFYIFIVFLGTLTEWLFIFVVFVAFAARMIFRQGKIRFRQFIVKQLDLAIPALVALSLYIYQVRSTWLVMEALSRFSERFRLGDSLLKVTHFYDGINHILSYYGYPLCISAALCLFAYFCYYAFIRGKAVKRGDIKFFDAYMLLICLSVFPCLLHWYTFQQHALEHNFSALKWVVPLSLIPFGIIPVVLNYSIRQYRSRPLLNLLICLLLILLGYRAFSKARVSFRSLFEPGTQIYNPYKRGEIIERNSAYNNICFAFTFSFRWQDGVNFSGKKVYQIDNFKQAKDKIAEFADKGAIGKIFIEAQDWDRFREEAVKNCSKIYRDEDFYICEIDPRK